MSESRRVLLGRITGAQGLKGEVVVHSFAEAPEDIAAYGPLSDAEGGRTFDLSVVRVAEKGVIARVRGVGDRTPSGGAERRGALDRPRAAAQRPRRANSIMPT